MYAARRRELDFKILGYVLMPEHFSSIPSSGSWWINLETGSGQVGGFTF